MFLYRVGCILSFSSICYFFCLLFISLFSFRFSLCFSLIRFFVSLLFICLFTFYLFLTFSSICLILLCNITSIWWPFLHNFMSLFILFYSYYCLQNIFELTTCFHINFNPIQITAIFFIFSHFLFFFST